MAAERDRRRRRIRAVSRPSGEGLAPSPPDGRRGGPDDSGVCASSRLRPPRGVSPARHRHRRRHARSGARARRLYQCRHPSVERVQCQARERADASLLGRDRHLRGVPSDLFVEGWRWPVLVANRAEESRTLVADVVGQSCGFDLLVPDALLPASVTPGDTIALLDTGAYDEPSASNFNAMPRPATVLVCRNQAEIVKRRETYDDVFRREVIPQRLR